MAKRTTRKADSYLNKALRIMKKKNPRMTMKNARKRLDRMLASMGEKGSKF